MTRTPEQVQDIDWEHRITRIEGAIENGFRLQAAETRTLTIEVAGMKEQVKTQNGRITKIESWKEFLTGIKEGKAEIGTAQLLFLGIFGPMVFAGLDIALRQWL